MTQKHQIWQQHSPCLGSKLEDTHPLAPTVMQKGRQSFLHKAQRFMLLIIILCSSFVNSWGTDLVTMQVKNLGGTLKVQKGASVVGAEKTSTIGLLDIWKVNSYEVTITSNSKGFGFSNQNVDLESINLSQAPNLIWLWLTQTSLQSIDLSQNSKLEVLGCSSSEITSLDISQNKLLEKVEVVNNKSLTSLDVSQNTKLKRLACHRNKLTTLTLGQQQQLTYLACSFNALTSLDVRNAPMLDTLYVGLNELASLDVSRNTKLKVLDCPKNKLTTLTLGEEPQLKYLVCSSNALTSLDITKAKKLDTLYLAKNQLTELELPFDSQLKVVDCSENKLNTLKVQKQSYLTYLSCHTNQLRGTDTSNAPALEKLYISRNNITNFYSNNNLNLKILDCSWNKIENLIFWKPELIFFDCSHNELTSLNTKNAPKLEKLLANKNKLEELEVSWSTKLKTLDCSSNKLRTLNLERHPQLTYLDCSNNILSSLKITGAKSLNFINCSRNKLIESSTDEMMESLPSAKGKVIVYDGNGEKNFFTESAVAVAKSKGWSIVEKIEGEESPYEGIRIKITNLSLRTTSLQLFPFETYQLHVTILPQNATHKNIRWKIIKGNSVTVSSTGLITANSVGKSTVRAESTDGSNLYADCEVTVRPLLVKELRFIRKADTLVLGEKFTFNVKAFPSKATNQGISWRNSAPDVLQDLGNGTFKAIKNGEAILTATTVDGSNISIRHKVTVIAPTNIANLYISAHKPVLDIDGNTLVLSNVDRGKQVHVLDLQGRLIYQTKSNGEIQRITIFNLPPTFIVKIGNMSYKLSSIQ